MQITTAYVHDRERRTFDRLRILILGGPNRLRDLPTIQRVASTTAERITAIFLKPKTHSALQGRKYKMIINHSSSDTTLTRLRTTLRINAASCIGFGTLFVAAPRATAAFLGSMPSTLILTLGIALIANGTHLILGSLRRKPWPAEIIWFSFGDMIWLLATIVLLAMQVWITSPAGTIAATLVALMVGGLGLMQMALLQRLSSNPPAANAR